MRFNNFYFFYQLIILLKFNPIKVNNKHKIRDEKIYSNANNTLFSIIISIDSIVKVEKVVKDPRIPIIKKYLIKSWEIFLFWVSEIKYPIKKQPIILTIKVLIK